MAKKALSILCSALTLIPLTAAAQALDLRAEIDALMQQIAVLEAELQQKIASPSPPTPQSSLPSIAPGPVSTICTSLSRTLELGASGNDVAGLQRFLASDPSVYPEGIVSGYFGALTEKAVQRFQAKSGIASRGSAATNGYGAVGPRTRARIAELGCGALPGLETGGSVPRCAIRADKSMIVPGQPVTVSWNSANALTAIDNTSGVRVALRGSAVFYPKIDTTYTYSFFGNDVSAPAVCSIRIKFPNGGIAPVIPPPTPTPPSPIASGDILTVSASQGAAPLYVQLIFKARPTLTCGERQLSIEYGDGEGGMLETNLCAALNARSVYHLYKKTGAFTARVYDNTLCVSNLRCDRSVEVGRVLVSVSGFSACTLGSVTAPHGSSRDFYNSSRALADETCASRRLSRLCLDGTFSGDPSYSFSSCKEATELSCTLDGVVLQNGSSRAFYSTNSVAAGNSCSSVALSRTCTDGTLSGSDTYNKANCIVAPPTCTLDGVTLAHGSSTTFYFAQNVPHGEQCSSYGQVRTCSTGTFLGSSSYKYATCAPVSATSCALDNVVLTNGSSAQFYANRTAPAGTLCSASVQTRTCTNGTLGGSSAYIYASCTNQTSCTLDGITLNHGSTTVFYKATAVPFGTTCSSVSLSRACTNGKLSGSDDYKYASCSVTAP